MAKPKPTGLKGTMAERYLDHVARITGRSKDAVKPKSKATPGAKRSAAGAAY
jgi:hypothetical protein